MNWPSDLKLNAAAARLASALYYAEAEAFGGKPLHFDGLDVATRHRYTELAAGLLRSLAPKPVTFATGLRSTANKIVGFISPDMGGAA